MFSCRVSFLISIQAAETMHRLGGDRSACFVVGVPAGRGARVPQGFPAPPQYPEQVYEQLSWRKASWEPAVQPSCETQTLASALSFIKDPRAAKV